MDKNERNAMVFKMFNEGKTERQIAEFIGLSKTAVHKILTPLVVKETVSPKIKKEIVKLTGTEERFTSFVGWERTNVNEYSHKETGEVIRVAFVKAKGPNEFGYFVKLGEANGAEVKSE
jgi:DNA-binding transcriptional regulator LsrR (DeoR family)